jgi:hypothetical protein
VTNKLKTCSVLFATLALGACGGDKDPKSADGKDAKAAAGKEDAKAAEKVPAEEGDAASAEKDDAASAEAPDDGNAGGGGADLVEYIPKGANVVAATDIKAFFASSLGAYYKLALSQLQGESAETMNAAVACDVGPETWTSAALGADTTNPDASIFAFEGTGLGEKETLECLANKAKEAGAEESWTVGETDGTVTVDVGDGKARIYAVNDDLVVVASSAFIEPAGQLIAGEGAKAIDDVLKEPMAGVDRSKTIFIAGIAPPDLASGPMAGLAHGSATIDVTSGLAIGVRMDFAEPGQAASASKQFQQQLDQFKPVAQNFVPKPVLDSLSIESKEKTVTATIKANEAELEQLQQKLQQTMGASMAGAGAAPTPPGSTPEPEPGR